MISGTFRVLYCLSTSLLLVESAQNVAIHGFPEVWDGDKYHHVLCPSQNVPTWLDGYLLAQVGGSYGNQTDGPGSKVTHMFDAIGGVASLAFKNGEVYFSGEYYPAKPNNVWSFYNRNMSQSHLAWHPVRSPYNETAAAVWEPILKNDNSFPIHPNFNFWLIGNTVVAVTEIFQLGLRFNVSSLTNFVPYDPKDNSNKSNTFTVLSVGAHERSGPNGSVYAGAVAYDPNVNKMYHIVYNIHPDGIRTVEGLHEYGAYDPSSCGDNGAYNGDKNNLAGYVHSITSTASYVILPIGSNVINPCKLQPINKNAQTQINGEIKMDNPPLEFVERQPVKFLIFDKTNKRFTTEKPIETGLSSVFITDQLNAYQDQNGLIVADMIGYENINPYDLLTTDNLFNKTTSWPNMNLYRIQINPQTNEVQQPTSSKINYEQPSYNRNFEELPYKFAYAVTNPFVAGNSIVKIDVTNQQVVSEYKAPRADVVLREPWFVPSQASPTIEDSGVVLVLAGDATTNKSNLYILDAQTFSLISCVPLPSFVPFGFHGRYFSQSSLTCQNNCQALREMVSNSVASSNSGQVGDRIVNQTNNSVASSNNGQVGDQTVNQTINPSINQTFQLQSASTTSYTFTTQPLTSNNSGGIPPIVGGIDFSRVDNVTMYPPTDAWILANASTQYPSSTTSGNTLTYQSNNGVFVGHTRLENSSSPSTTFNLVVEPLDNSSNEFFRTTIVVETTQPQSSSSTVSNNSSATVLNNGLINNGGFNDNTSPPNNVGDNFSPRNVGGSGVSDNQPPISSCVTNNNEPNWLRIVNVGRSFLCAFLKKPIDDSGFDLCQFNRTNC